MDISLIYNELNNFKSSLLPEQLEKVLMIEQRGLKIRSIVCYRLNLDENNLPLEPTVEFIKNYDDECAKIRFLPNNEFEAIYQDYLLNKNTNN